MTPSWPFVGRTKEIARLQRLHTQRKHVLIVGEEGIGKSALVAHVQRPLRLRVCPGSERLSEICEALEGELGLEAGDLHLITRKNRILRQLKSMTGRAGIPLPAANVKDGSHHQQSPGGAHEVTRYTRTHEHITIVFDGASWTTPKLASFIENVAQRAPVWLCVRSERPWDIGRIWPLLVRFEHVELKPFHPGESLLLVEATVRGGTVPADTLNIAGWLHRQAAGNPKILRELLEEIARSHYDLSSPLALQRLNLDRRIRKIFPLQ